MKVFVSPLAPEDTTMVTLDWPSFMRVPVEGETLMFGTHNWRVEHVIFDLDSEAMRGDPVQTMAVLLRVASQ